MGAKVIKRFLLAVAVMFLSATAFAQFDVGFDFRATSTFVTDPSCCTYEIGSAVDYPITRTVNGSSVTFGWESVTGTLGPRDRSSSLDARLAGLANFANDGTSTGTFRVDLPSAGVYSIGLGIGDNTHAQNTYLTVEDGTTSLISFNPIATTGSNYIDAAGNTWTNTTWPASNVMVSKTFSTTILRVKLGGTASTNSSVINHLRVTQVSSASPAPCQLAVHGACFDDLESKFSTDSQALVQSAQSSDASANLYLQNELAPLLKLTPPTNPPTLDAVNTAKLATATAAATVATDLGNILDFFKQALVALVPQGISAPVASAPIATPVAAKP